MTSAAQLYLPLHERMPRANYAVFQAMASLGTWSTLRQIAEKARLSEGTVSTRVSENAREYGAAYLKRKVNTHYEYRLA